MIFHCFPKLEFKKVFSLTILVELKQKGLKHQGAGRHSSFLLWFPYMGWFGFCPAPWLQAGDQPIVSRLVGPVSWKKLVSNGDCALSCHNPAKIQVRKKTRFHLLLRGMTKRHCKWIGAGRVISFAENSLPCEWWLIPSLLLTWPP